MDFNLLSIIGFTSGVISGVAQAAEESAPITHFHHDWHSHSHGFWWVIVLMIFLYFVFIRPRRHRHRWFWRWVDRDRHDFFGNHHHAESKSAISILSERYARGEIDKDEYEERKAVLSKQSTQRSDNTSDSA